jgi:hypothetical protein
MLLIHLPSSPTKIKKKKSPTKIKKNDIYIFSKGMQLTAHFSALILITDTWGLELKTLLKSK